MQHTAAGTWSAAATSSASTASAPARADLERELEEPAGRDPQAAALTPGLVANDHEAREALLQPLRTAVRRCRTGIGYSVALRGEAGIGKTWCLRHALEDARAAGLLPLLAQAASETGAPSLWPFIQLLRQLCVARVSLGSELAPLARELGAFVPELAIGCGIDAAAPAGPALAV